MNQMDETIRYGYLRRYKATDEDMRDLFFRFINYVLTHIYFVEPGKWNSFFLLEFLEWSFLGAFKDAMA